MYAVFFVQQNGNMVNAGRVVIRGE